MVSVLVGIASGLVYGVLGPDHSESTWPPLAAQILATLLVALIITKQFDRIERLTMRDAVSVALILLLAAISFLIALLEAASGHAFPRGLGILVVGATSAMGWLALADIFDGLIQHSVRLWKERKLGGSPW